MRNVVLAQFGRRFQIIGQPPAGVVGSPYNYPFSTVGGTAPISWICTPTPLGSSGAAFSAGVLSSASLTNGGSYAFTLEAIDANRQRASANFILVVLGATSYRLVTEAGNPIITEGGAPMVPQ